MKTTQEQRAALRQTIDDAEDDVVVAIGDHEFWRKFRGSSASIVQCLLDDADRAAQLEAQLTHVRRWAACQAGLRNVPAAEVQDLVTTLDSRLWNAQEPAPIDQLEEAIRFLLSLVPGWTKEVPEGLDPTFYGTCSAEHDREVKHRVDSIRRLLEDQRD